MPKHLKGISTKFWFSRWEKGTRNDVSKTLQKHPRNCSPWYHLHLEQPLINWTQFIREVQTTKRSNKSQQSQKNLGQLTLSFDGDDIFHRHRHVSQKNNGHMSAQKILSWTRQMRSMPNSLERLHLGRQLLLGRTQPKRLLVSLIGMVCHHRDSSWSCITLWQRS